MARLLTELTSQHEQFRAVVSCEVRMLERVAGSQIRFEGVGVMGKIDGEIRLDQAKALFERRMRCSGNDTVGNLDRRKPGEYLVRRELAETVILHLAEEGCWVGVAIEFGKSTSRKSRADLGRQSFSQVGARAIQRPRTWVFLSEAATYSA